MKWPKRFMVGLSALLLLAMTAAYLIPLDTYVPGLESALEEQLHEPVSIRHLRVAMLPWPHLEMQEVHLGGQDGIAVRSILVEPDFAALLTGNIVLQRILVQDGTANLAQVRKLAELFGNVSVNVSVATLRELQLSGISLVTPEATLGPIEGKLEFAKNGKLERIGLAMDKLTLTLLPQTDHHFTLQMQARNWALPQFPQMRLDDLQVAGVLGEQDFVVQNFSVRLRGIHLTGSAKVGFLDGWQVRATLDKMDAPLEQVMAMLAKPVELTGVISAKGVFSGKADTLGALKNNFQFSGDMLVRHATARIAVRHPLIFDQIRAHVVVHPKYCELDALEARLYGGKLSGKVSINHAMLDAKLAVNGIAMQPLVEVFTNALLFTGGMDGAAKFTLNLETVGQFPKNMQLVGNFHLHNGLLAKVDLLQAASGKASAGATRFDDLTGLLAVDANGYHFRKLKIGSGSLNAEGKVDISPALQLHGILDAKVKGTAGLVSMPMVVSGTLNEPIVRLSGSAMAGAAVGTAILGPGLGTAVGIKVGGFLHKLFGKDNDKNTDTVPKPPVRK